MTGAGDTVAQDALKSIVRRVEAIEDRVKAENEDKSEIYKEARSNGLDVKIIRKVIAARRKDASERDEQEALFELYWTALHGVAHAHVETIEEFRPGGASEARLPPKQEVAGSSPAPVTTEPQPDHAPAEQMHGDESEPASAIVAMATSLDRAEGIADGQPISERTPVQAIMDQVLASKRQWKHSDPAHPDCLNPSGCGGFSNLKLCERCREASDMGQVA